MMGKHPQSAMSICSLTTGGAGIDTTVFKVTTCTLTTDGARSDTAVFGVSAMYVNFICSSSNSYSNRSEGTNPVNDV